MAKLHINDLHYLVMEGGGARGNTYLGAIRALEEQLKKRQEENQATVFKADADLSGRSGIPGLLDYLELNDEGEKVPVIRGVAGASAGAITTFALTLGLNSAEIDEVLKFDFTQFLSETDVAKYRMIGEDSDLMIGEDSKIDIDTTNQAKDYTVSRLKVVGGSRSEPFHYNLDKDKTKISENKVKKFIRGQIIGLTFKVIFSGLLKNLAKVLPFIETWQKNFKKNGALANKLEKLFKFLGDSAAPVAGFVENFVYKTLIKKGVFKALNMAMPIKVDNATIGGLIWDRGMFSGFQVREFFYDMMIYAATRDTHFQRRLIETYNGKPISNGLITFTKEDLTALNFEIGKRTKVTVEPNVKRLFEHLQNITFEEFYEITKIDYAAAVSNHTRDTMLYFSHRWTPQFRVLEAVGSSMSIPPAIRPVYNAADVVFDTQSPTPGQAKFPRKNHHQSIHVMVNGQSREFVNSKGRFERTDYELYAYVVKKALQQDLLSGSSETYVDLNNGIELYAFLPKLRDIVVGNYIKDGGGKRVRSALSVKNRTVLVNEDTYEVNDDLLTFFYNAQFKGLLLDGGYRNNIPYNYFRDRNPNLDGVLAVKLDGNFPPDFLAQVNGEIKNYLRFENEMLEKLDDDIFELPRIQGFKDKSEQLKADTYGQLDKDYEILIKHMQVRFTQYLNSSKCTSELLEQENPIEVNVSREMVLKLLKQWIKFYGKENLIKPWEVSKSIFATAMEGYSYGSERGQIRKFSDHNHVISVYDFGVGTYDFDLDKVISQAKMSQSKAREAIHCYFHQAS